MRVDWHANLLFKLLAGEPPNKEGGGHVTASQLRDRTATQAGGEFRKIFAGAVICLLVLQKLRPPRSSCSSGSQHTSLRRVRILFPSSSPSPPGVTEHPGIREASHAVSVVADLAGAGVIQTTLAISAGAGHPGCGLEPSLLTPPPSRSALCFEDCATPLLSRSLTFHRLGWRVFPPCPVFQILVWAAA